MRERRDRLPRFGPKSGRRLLVQRVRTVLPDTNVVLRYLLRDHEEHYVKAYAFFEAVREGKRRALLLDGVLVECVYVLTKFYRVPRTETDLHLHWRVSVHNLAWLSERQ